MDPITIGLALVGLGVGFGASTVVTKRKLGSAQDAASKELKKAKKEAERAQQDTAFAEREIEAAKKRLAEQEKNLETSRQKSIQAAQRLGRATARWEEASDILEREWQQSGRY